MRIVGLMFISCLVGVSACTRNPIAAVSATKQLTVFAAASTTDVMREIGAAFEQESGMKVVFSFDSSSNLAKQIESGAPADVFISADETWMDALESAGAIQPSTRQDLLANELVMIAPAGKMFDAQLRKGFDFANALPQIKRIAIGDPTHVPAGIYARQSLGWLGWGPKVSELLIPARDVRAALRLVEIGEADAGVVYATDAQQSDKIVVIGTFPAESHDPIHYPIAICKDSSPSAATFLEFLKTSSSIKVFERKGFRVLTPSGADLRGDEP